MKTQWQTITFICLTAIFLSACSNENSSKTGNEFQHSVTFNDTIKRGEYLVATMGCNDCHTPKKMGTKGPEFIKELLLSGYPSDRKLPQPDEAALASGWILFNSDLTASTGPWGTSFAANLTPDETGLGSWNYEQFKKALTQGKYKGLDGTRPLLPPMPWQNFTNISEPDLRAIFLYLKSIKPVKNAVPEPLPPVQH